MFNVPGEGVQIQEWPLFEVHAVPIEYYMIVIV